MIYTGLKYIFLCLVIKDLRSQGVWDPINDQ